MRRPRTRDSFIPSMQIPKIHAKNTFNISGKRVRPLPVKLALVVV
tara:strand:+ start:195 stop:329 length:135 start_codon:yes stop_codon:yes gene_type:complete